MQPPTLCVSDCLRQAQDYLNNLNDEETIDLALAYLDDAEAQIKEQTQEYTLMPTSCNRTRLNALFGEAYFLKAYMPHINWCDKRYYIHEAWYYLMQTAHQSEILQLRVQAHYLIGKLYMMLRSIPNAQLYLQLVTQQVIDLDLQAKAHWRLRQMEELLCSTK